MGALTASAVALCRLWTAIYTCGMPAELGAARRAEIDSDLWECQTDAGESGRVAASILLRLLLGLPNDLLWRLELTERRARTRQSLVALAGVVAALVMTAVWMGFSLLNQELPPPAPAMSFISAPPPPPPPPPPPGNSVKQFGEADRRQGHGIDR